MTDSPEWLVVAINAVSVVVFLCMQQVTKERDELRAQLAAVTAERDELRTELAAMTAERDKLQRRFDAIPRLTPRPMTAEEVEPSGDSGQLAEPSVGTDGEGQS